MQIILRALKIGIFLLIAGVGESFFVQYKSCSEERERGALQQITAFEKGQQSPSFWLQQYAKQLHANASLVWKDRRNPFILFSFRFSKFQTASVILKGQSWLCIRIVLLSLWEVRPEKYVIPKILQFYFVNQSVYFTHV